MMVGQQEGDPSEKAPKWGVFLPRTSTHSSGSTVKVTRVLGAAEEACTTTASSSEGATIVFDVDQKS